MSRSSAPAPATPSTHHGKPEPEAVRAAAPGCEIRHVPLVITRYSRPLGQRTINVRPPPRTVRREHVEGEVPLQHDPLERREVARPHDLEDASCPDGPCLRLGQDECP